MTQQPPVNLTVAQPTQGAFKIKQKPAPLLPQDDSPDGWYQLWKSTQHPDAGAGLLRAMDADIRAATRKYAGSDDPVALAQGRQLFVGSIGRYDPAKGTSLATYTDRQLQPLIRWKARKELPVRVPTLKARQIRQILSAEDELTSELGRSPSLVELADQTGMHPKKIQALKKLKYPVLSDQWQAGKGDDEMMQLGDQAATDDNEQLWTKVVYHSLAPAEQVILQHSTGLYGAEVLSNAEIAKKLHVSPGRVSQLRTKIQSMLDDPNQMG